MPWAVPSACVVPGCPGHGTVKGRCRAHALTEADRPNQDVRRWYRTARWARLRDQVRARNPLCIHCERAGRIEGWTDVDHIVPHRGDPRLFWDVDNLQGLCAGHHAEKTGRGE